MNIFHELLGVNLNGHLCCMFKKEERSFSPSWHIVAIVWWIINSFTCFEHGRMCGLVQLFILICSSGKKLLCFLNHVVSI
jgi:hypothetical protein